MVTKFVSYTYQIFGMMYKCTWNSLNVHGTAQLEKNLHKFTVRKIREIYGIKYKFVHVPHNLQIYTILELH